MPATESWNRTLTPQQIWLLCLTALALHVLPLVLADYAYMDDVWRSQLAGNDWAESGRPLAAALFAGIGFSAAGVNVYPLPLLLACLVTSLAMTRLVCYWFVAPRISAVLVVLPLWYSPFFLQNLSYQYDGAAMALAVALSAWVITVGVQRWRTWLWGIVLVAAVAALYQVAVNLLVGLCCVDILRRVLDGSPAQQVWRHAGVRLVQLVGGCLVYAALCMSTISVPRVTMLALDMQWPGTLLARLGLAFADIALLITPGTRWMILAMLALALLGLLAGLVRVWRRPLGWPLQLAMTLGALALVGVAMVMTSGLMLLFAHYDHGARTLMGFAALLVMIGYLAHDLLHRLQPRLALLLAIPVLFMLSFAFAYGRVLLVQKDLQQTVAMSLAHDITSHPALARAQRYYLHDIGSSGQWLPAASGSMQTMPALRYVLNINFILLPEMMPRHGLSHFGSTSPLSREQVLARSPAPLVDNTFYAIRLLDDTAYVLMKSPQGRETYQW